MRPILAVSALLFAMPAAAQTDPLLSGILAEAAKQGPLAFERTVRAEELGENGKASVEVDRFNPRAAADAQWKLVSIDGRAPTAKEIEQHRKKTAGVPIPGFYRISTMLAKPPAKKTESGGRISYQWDSLPAGSFMTPGGDISGNLSAELVVEQVSGKPKVDRLRIYAAKPFSIRSVAKMNQFDAVNQYRPGPSGQPFLSAQSQLTDVSAPFGMGGKRKNVVSFRAL